MASPAEQRAMRRAIQLAARGGSHPNPTVGAVLLDESGNEVAAGVTDVWPGLAHGEIRALESATVGTDGLTMVATLEPCNHQGRSAPCTQAIVAAGLTRVVIGAMDPDSRVQGAGVEALRSAGIEVEAGVMADEVESTDPAYFFHRHTGRARLLLKSATTLDGSTAARDGTSQWITTQAARADVHRLRAASDAVLIGAGTLRSDDPMLTVRFGSPPARQPTAVVVAGNQPLPPHARLWTRPGTLVISVAPSGLDVETIQVAPGDDGWPDPFAIATALGDRGLLAVLVEGGARLAGSLWRAGAIEAGVTYLGAKLAGGVGVPIFAGDWHTMDEATPIEITEVQRLDEDVRIDWRIDRPLQE